MERRFIETSECETLGITSCPFFSSFYRSGTDGHSRLVESVLEADTATLRPALETRSYLPIVTDCRTEAEEAAVSSEEGCAQSSTIF